MKRMYERSVIISLIIYNCNRSTDTTWFLKEIYSKSKDPSTVNKRRKAAGFNETVEENAKSLGIDHKVFP